MEIIAADTDIFIDFLRGKGPYVDAFTNLLETGKIGIVVISACELFVGASTVQKENYISLLIGKVEILEVDLQASKVAAGIFKKLKDFKKLKEKGLFA